MAGATPRRSVATASIPRSAVSETPGAHSAASEKCGKVLRGLFSWLTARAENHWVSLASDIDFLSRRSLYEQDSRKSSDCGEFHMVSRLVSATLNLALTGRVTAEERILLRPKSVPMPGITRRRKLHVQRSEQIELVDVGTIGPVASSRMRLQEIQERNQALEANSSSDGLTKKCPCNHRGIYRECKYLTIDKTIACVAQCYR